MNKNWLLIPTLLMTLSGTAGAVTLSLSPSSLTIPVSTDYSVDLVVSELDIPGGEVIGGFDVDISFDPTQASFLGYNLGTSLGDEGLFEAVDFSLGDLGGGLIDLAEVSLLSTPDLLAIQTESFTLATLDFHCLGCGTSLIEIIANDPMLAVSDGFGLPLPVTIGGGTEVTQVPEPSVVLLLAAGMLALGFTKSRAKN